jgi:ApeA N-terminal domain 1
VKIPKKARTALSEGRSLTGHFVPAGLETREVAGILSWSFEDGARLELVGDTEGWPAMDAPHFVVHGSLRDGGDVSLLHAWIRSTAMVDEVTAVWSSTLALGEHVDLDAVWVRAIYSTAHLTEWRGVTGLDYSHSPESKSESFHVAWKRPETEEVDVPGARLSFGGSVDTVVSWSADWSISTRQDLVVEPDNPLTLDDGWRRFASPLLNLMSFAADRPDGIVHEVLTDGARRRVEIWRQGQTVRAREWHPTRGFVFRARNLPDFSSAMRSWWALDERLRPALGLFADHVSHGYSYSPARFLTLFTAVEAYAHECHGRHNLRILRDFADVPENIIGCTDEALRIIGASRKYFAHLSRPANGPTVDEIEAQLLSSTRRASALMQACLLRELNFPAADAERILREYYGWWPLS